MGFESHQGLDKCSFTHCCHMWPGDIPERRLGPCRDWRTKVGSVSNLTKAWTNAHSHIVIRCGQATSQNADLATLNQVGLGFSTPAESHQGLGHCCCTHIPHMCPGNTPERRLGLCLTTPHQGGGGFPISPRPGQMFIHTLLSHVARRHPRTPTRPMP